MYEENLGMMYISQMLKNHGHIVDIVEADCSIISKHLEDNIPTILAFSTLAFYCDFYIELSARLKKKHRFLSIFVSQHTPGCPDIISR